MATPSPENAKKSIWNHLLELDNNIIGLFICAFAAYDWMAFYDGFDQLTLYYSQRLYALPSLSILNILSSAVYLTFAGIILLSLKPPRSKYRSILPNIIALAAGFGVYVFVWLPSGSLLGVSIYVALTLIVLGTTIVITSLVFLRQAFSVTPQARFLVTAGPYSVIRHPMYLGNIISLFGLALLIDSPVAIALFFVCSGLQVWRALYEERLLLANIDGYAEYRNRVGRFLPKLKPARVAPALVLVLTALSLFASGNTSTRQASAAAIGQACAHHGNSAKDCMVAPSLNATRRYHLRFADSAADALVKKCRSWYNKATSGEWFNQKEADDLFKADEMLADSRPKGCEQFYELVEACGGIIVPWLAKEITDSKFLRGIETTNGCVSMAGLDNICEALNALAKKGVVLSESRRSLYVDCATADLRRRRVQFIRPAI